MRKPENRFTIDFHPIRGSVQERKTILLVISTGWGVRTFLQTRVLPILQARSNIVILAHPALVGSIRHVLGEAVAVEPLRPFAYRTGAYGRAHERRTYHFMHVSRTGTRSADWKRHQESLRGRWRRLAYHFALEAEARLFASSRTLNRMLKREERLFFREYPHVNYYADILRRYKPDLVISTVAFIPEEAPPVLVSRRMGIKTAAWVNSWDNLTSKPPFFSEYDTYFVWSNRMKEELRRFYPESRGRPIEATGVPHFDWYHAPQYLRSRDSFCADLGLDSSRPIVLYTTATPHLCPKENQIVERLAAELSGAGPLNGLQLVVRLHPGDGGDRFDVRQFGPDVRFQMPGRKTAGQVSAYYPTEDENREYVNTIIHADVVVNMASTTTLDASVCDRPVVNIAYYPTSDPAQQAKIEQYYTVYDHYRTVMDLDSVWLARSHDQMLRHIEAALADPECRRDERSQLVALWCGANDGQSGARMGRALLACAGINAYEHQAG